MMRRRLAATLLLAGALASGCSQGFVLEDGQRPPAELTDAKFVFAGGETEIDMRPAPTSLEPTPTPEPTASPTQAPRPTPSAAPTPQIRSLTPAGATAAAETPAPTAAASAAPGGAAPQATTAEPATTAAAPVDMAAIAANPLASSIVIPKVEVDPGLETFDETSDPSRVFAPDIFVDVDIVSFAATFSGRQPESGALSERQRLVQLVQFVFVHGSAETAATFYEFLGSNFISSSAATRVEAMQEPYPDIDSSLTGFGNVPQIADEVTLAVLEMDPNVAEGSPASGPGVPTIYYIVLREGRMTAVIEIVYLLEQDPSDVLLIGNVLVSRIPPELQTSDGP